MLKIRRFRKLDNSNLFLNNLLSPFSIFNGDDKSAIIVFRNYVSNIVKSLNLSELVGDIIKEDEDKMTVFITDVIVFLLVNDFDIDINDIDKTINKSEINKLSNNYASIHLEVYVKKLQEKYFSDVKSIKELFEKFKYLQTILSDENFVIRRLIEMIVKTTKYDTYNIVYNGLTIPLGSAKILLNAVKDSEFTPEPYDSYFKLASVCVNGISKEGQLIYNEGDIIEAATFDNFYDIYYRGSINNLSKLVSSIIRNIELVIASKNDSLLAQLQFILNDKSLIFTQKIDNINKLVSKELAIKYNIEEFVNSIYNLPLPEKVFDEYVEKDTKYTYEEILVIKDKFEDDKNIEMENAIVNALFKSSAKQYIPLIIEMNNSIENKIKQFNILFPDQLKDLFSQLSTYIATNMIAQLFNYPKSLGKIVVESVEESFKIANEPSSEPQPEPEPEPEPQPEPEPEPEPEVKCDSILDQVRDSSGIFALNTIFKLTDLVFCILKRELEKSDDNQYVDTYKKYLLENLK